MGSKTKFLYILILLGCLLNNVYTLKTCTEIAGNNSSTSGSGNGDDDGIGCINGKTLIIDGDVQEEGYYFFDKEDLYIDDEYVETKTPVKAVIGYSCANKVCEIIKDDGLYEIEEDDDNYFNVYQNNGNLSYQLIINNAKSGGMETLAYLNKGVSTPTLTKAIILCNEEDGCSIKNDPADGDVYLTESTNGSTPSNDSGSVSGSSSGSSGSNYIIKCSSSKGCIKTPQSEEAYYLNAGDTEKPLIICEKDTEDATKAICKLGVADDNNVYYINSQSTKSIIYCSETDSCSLYVPTVNSFFLNSGKDKQTNPLINCYSKTCSAHEAKENGYYLTYIEDELMYEIIYCSDSENCVSKGKGNNKGYYKNADDNTSQSYPLIECNTNDGCKSLKIGQDILPGYYIDNSGSAPVVIYCNENSCVDGTTNYNNQGRNGNFVYSNEQLKLVIDASKEDDGLSSVASSSESSDALYYFIEVPSSYGFPSVSTTNFSTLYKVSKYYIARVITDGVIFVDDSTNKVSENGTPGNGNTIYTCNKDKKVCVESKSCVVDTYVLDVKNNYGYYCNSKEEMKRITVDGYYINSSNGNARRSVMSCVSGDCKAVTSTNYFVNAGSDNRVNPLIYCSSTCRTTTATNGYYLSGVKDSNDNVGIIKCSSSSSCELITSANIKKTEHYYLNNGNDKAQKALIKCSNKSCTATAASDGYFITSDSSILILCENAVSCTSINASAGYYNAAVTADTGKKIIECTALANVNCELKDANVGYYVAKTSNILINCNVTPCKAITVTNGIYRSATTQIISTKRDVVPGEDENKEVSNEERATTSVVYNIISCSSTGCNELTTSELLSIPVCTFSNNKCFINNRVTISTSTVNSISAGSYCTNSDRSVIYFATDTVVVDPYIIDGTTSIYTYTTTTTNCIEAINKYSDNYYTVGSNIFKVAEYTIVQIVDTGYYFINVDTNTLVNGNNIENYNNENVKLFKCNDSSCSIVDKPDTVSYFADVNKKIIQYNPNSDAYSFAYDESVICIYANNKCTPRSDIKGMEFCITYKGELALVTNDIKSRETGECYKADSISSKVYGLSQYMYVMNAFAAERIVDTAYYVVSMSTNSTATIRDYDGRNNSVRVYGCVESKCEIVNPKEGVYYYDSVSTYMFRYTNSKWVSPSASGYALVSVDPTDTYINRFSLSNNRTKIDGKVKTGYYYTIDNEMYECDQDKYQCEKITSNGLYFTVNGEIYKCVYDSEGFEETECIRKNCIVGQYYYIESKYYYCGSGYILSLVSDKTCEYDDRVIINFPVAYSESYPEKIKEAVENVASVNNSTAVATAANSKYVSAVSGVFTNCTYTVEEKESEFDLVCINNYVALNEESDNVEICSLAQMGYIECVDDANNPEKCNISGANTRITKGFAFIVTLIISSLFFLYI